MVHTATSRKKGVAIQIHEAIHRHIALRPNINLPDYLIIVTQRFVATTTLAMSLPTELIHPNAHGTNSELQAAVHTMMDASIPQNTRRAFSPKMEEFFEFCDYVYGDKPWLDLAAKTVNTVCHVQKWNLLTTC
jgi:hypothetical protein